MHPYTPKPKPLAPRNPVHPVIITITTLTTITTITTITSIAVSISVTSHVGFGVSELCKVPWNGLVGGDLM